eukprot:TRINITY_DN10485_c1_g1_i9.p3 TRINITY_DN10485_c1_g1~~TRINITY_DN10485_c1_g1_i9.p3  ORF type:complete len:103 (+),score=4.66 TRINITY_DN10485_c1_g1_i9:361-669(+)
MCLISTFFRLVIMTDNNIKEPFRPVTVLNIHLGQRPIIQAAKDSGHSTKMPHTLQNSSNNSVENNNKQSKKKKQDKKKKKKKNICQIFNKSTTPEPQTTPTI